MHTYLESHRGKEFMTNDLKSPQATAESAQPTEPIVREFTRDQIKFVSPSYRAALLEKGIILDAPAPPAESERPKFEDNYSEAAAFAGITFSQACQFDMYMKYLLGKGPKPGFVSE